MCASRPLAFKCASTCKFVPNTLEIVMKICWDKINWIIQNNHWSSCSSVYTTYRHYYEGCFSSMKHKHLAWILFLFALARVIVLVTSQVPIAMDLVLPSFIRIIYLLFQNIFHILWHLGLVELTMDSSQMEFPGEWYSHKKCPTLVHH